MQECDPLGRTFTQPAPFPEVPNLFALLLRPGHKILQRTAASWATLAIGNGSDAIVDVQSHVLGWRSRVFGFAREDFKDRPSAHRRDLTLPPFAIVGNVCEWQMLGVVDYVKSCNHRSNIPIVNTAAISNYHVVLGSVSYKLKNRGPASGPSIMRFVVALSQRNPSSAPYLVPGPAR
jgi:hypothetical protein